MMVWVDVKSMVGYRNPDNELLLLTYGLTKPLPQKLELNATNHVFYQSRISSGMVN
jgi:hypothetical protein